MLRPAQQAAIALAASLLVVQCAVQAWAHPGSGANCASCHTTSRPDVLTLNGTSQLNIPGLGLKPGFVVKQGATLPIGCTVTAGGDYGVTAFVANSLAGIVNTSDMFPYPPASSGWTEQAGKYYFTTAGSSTSPQSWTFNLPVTASTPIDYYTFTLRSAGKSSSKWSDAETFYVQVISALRDLTWNTTSGTWNTQSGNQVWTDGAAATAFAATDNVNFTQSAGGSIAVDAAGVTPTAVTISNTSGGYTFSGGPIGGGLNKTNAGLAVFQAANSFTAASLSGGTVETQTSGVFGSGPVTISGGATWNASTSTQSYSNVLTLGTGGATLSVAAPKLTLAGPINGAGGLTKAGPGTLELTGVNAFAGVTSVSGGTLQGNTASLPTAIALANNATVTFNQTVDGAFTKSITGAGALVKTGGSVLTLTGAASYTGPTTISSGTLRLAVATPVDGSVLWLDASTLNLANGATVTGLNDLSASHNNTVASGAPVFHTSALNGKGTIQFSGVQSLVTANNIGITGGDNRSVFAVMRRIGDTTSGVMALQMGNAGAYTGWGLTSQFNGIWAPYTNGSGGVSQEPVGRLAGTYELYDMLHQHGLPTSTAGTNYGYINGTSIGTASNTGDITTAPGPFYVGAGPAITSVSGDFAELLVYNSYLNDAQRQQVEAYLNYKWFGIGATSNLLPTSTAVSVAANAAMDLNGLMQTIGSLSGAGAVTLGNGTLTVQSTADSTFAGPITGLGGSLVKSGSNSLTLSGTSNYSGTTAISGGRLTVSGSLGNTTASVGGAATLSGTGSIAGRVIVAGGSSSSTQGTVNLVDAVLGTLTLSDPNPGETALTLGDSAAGSPSILDFEVGATADRILVSLAKLAVNPGGATVNITPLAGFHTGIFDLIDFGANQATGLSGLNLATTALPGYTLRLQSTATAEQLVVSAVPEPSTLALLVAGALGLIGIARGKRQPAR